MIYFISDGFMTKIGHTSVSSESRLKSLQTGNANDLELIFEIDGSQADEKNIHRLLEDDRVRGEWFHMREGSRGAVFLSVCMDREDVRTAKDAIRIFSRLCLDEKEPYELDEVIEFGKYRGELTVRQISEQDPEYLCWLIENVDTFDYIDKPCQRPQQPRVIDGALGDNENVI